MQLTLRRNPLELGQLKLNSRTLIMRKIRPFIVGLVGCILAFATVNNVSAQATDGTGKVVAKKGDARYFVAGDPTAHDVKVGMIVKPGMTIQTATGVGNYVDVIFNNSHAVEAP